MIKNQVPAVINNTLKAVLYKLYFVTGTSCNLSISINPRIQKTIPIILQPSLIKLISIHSCKIQDTATNNKMKNSIIDKARVCSECLIISFP